MLIGMIEKLLGQYRKRRNVCEDENRADCALFAKSHDLIPHMFMYSAHVQ